MFFRTNTFYCLRTQTSVNNVSCFYAIPFRGWTKKASITSLTITSLIKIGCLNLSSIATPVVDRYHSFSNLVNYAPFLDPHLNFFELGDWRRRGHFFYCSGKRSRLFFYKSPSSIISADPTLRSSLLLRRRYFYLYKRARTRWTNKFLTLSKRLYAANFAALFGRRFFPSESTFRAVRLSRVNYLRNKNVVWVGPKNKLVRLSVPHRAIKFNNNFFFATSHFTQLGDRLSVRIFYTTPDHTFSKWRQREEVKKKINKKSNKKTSKQFNKKFNNRSNKNKLKKNILNNFSYKRRRPMLESQKSPDKKRVQRDLEQRIIVGTVTYLALLKNPTLRFLKMQCAKRLHDLQLSLRFFVFPRLSSAVTSKLNSSGHSVLKKVPLRYLPRRLPTGIKKNSLSDCLKTLISDSNGSVVIDNPETSVSTSENSIVKESEPNYDGSFYRLLPEPLFKKVIYIRLTTTINNLIVTVTRYNGSTLFVRSVGYEKFFNSQKRSFTSCWQFGTQVGRMLRRIPSFRDRFFCFSLRGVLRDRRVRGFFRGFRKTGVRLHFIFFRPLLSYNGCRRSHYARTGRRYKFYF